MQADGAVRGDTTIPRPRRLRALLAIVVVAALLALLVWAAPYATGGVGAEDANPNAGSAAVIHDDAGNVHPDVGSAAIHDDAANVHAH